MNFLCRLNWLSPPISAYYKEFRSILAPIPPPKGAFHAPNEVYHYVKVENIHQNDYQQTFEDHRHVNPQLYWKLRIESDDHIEIARENQLGSHPNKKQEQKSQTPQINKKV